MCILDNPQSSWKPNYFCNNGQSIIKKLSLWIQIKSSDLKLVIIRTNIARQRSVHIIITAIMKMRQGGYTEFQIFLEHRSKSVLATEWEYFSKTKTKIKTKHKEGFNC